MSYGARLNSAMIRPAEQDSHSTDPMRALTPLVLPERAHLAPKSLADGTGTLRPDKGNSAIAIIGPTTMQPAGTASTNPPGSRAR